MSLYKRVFSPLKIGGVEVPNSIRPCYACYFEPITDVVRKPDA